MAFEQYQHLSQHRFLYEDSDIKQEHFLPPMDACQIYNQVAYPLYDELATTFQEPHVNLNFDMIKSMHPANTYLSACRSDIPSLQSTASAASIPSAASSTTGSPYSGHVQLVYNQTAVIEPEYAVPRVFDDAFAYSYESHIDTDTYFNQEIKPHTSFIVGKHPNFSYPDYNLDGALRTTPAALLESVLGVSSGHHSCYLPSHGIMPRTTPDCPPSA